MDSKQRRQKKRKDKRNAIKQAKFIMYVLNGVADELEAGKDVNKVINEIRECKIEMDKLLSEVEATHEQ